MEKRIQLLATVTLTVIGIAFSPKSQAVVSPPDGCYPAFTTAEGCNALAGLGSGLGNTGLGWYSLFSAGDANYNTGVGAGTLALTSGADSNTAVGTAAMLLNVNGPANTAVGANALVYNDNGGGNTAVGANALYNDNGGGNTANGAFALFGNTTGSFNVAIGWDALPNNDNGSGNVAIGEESLVNNMSGGDNTVLGAGAGANIQAGSNNVYIGSGVDANGPFDESDTIRIGRSPNATSPALHCFIGGIAAGGATANVQVDPTTGELLQVVSSARYKENIKPMDKASEVIFALKPVTFRYKKKFDAKEIAQFGLIAEEVAKVNPSLVLPDKEGKPYTVRYDAVNAMLLNEFLKEHNTVQEQGATIARLEKQVEVLTAGLQKVSAQLELNKRAPQTVLNNR